MGEGRRLVPIMLVTLKMVVFPIIARGILAFLYPYSGLEKGLYDNYLNFTFLYGILPPAITPVVLAQSFHIMPDLIIKAMLMAILLCAPYMFVTSLIFGVGIGDETMLAFQ